MKTQIRLAIIGCSFFCNAASQAITEPVAASYVSLGAYSSHFTDVYATRSNAASLAQLKQSAVAVYGERRFMISELSLYTASLGMVTGIGNFGFHGSYFGFNLSNQSQVSLSYGRKISAKADIGASFYYNQIRQAGIYGSSGSFTAGAGLLLHLTPKIHAGISIYNPTGASYDKEKQEHIPSQYSFGMGYDASEKLFIAAEMVKTEGFPVNVNAGFQYRFIPQFFIAGGIATANAKYYAALGWNLAFFRMDIAMSYHPQLGLSPGLLVLYSFGKKQQEIN